MVFRSPSPVFGQGIAVPFPSLLPAPRSLHLLISVTIASVNIVVVALPCRSFSLARDVTFWLCRRHILALSLSA